MRRTTMLWEAFVIRFEEAFEQYKRHRLTGEEAGELLGMSGCYFRRREDPTGRLWISHWYDEY